MTHFENRYATHPDEYRGMDSQQLRDRFIASSLFAPGELNFVHSHEDRMIVGGASPLPGAAIALVAPADVRADFFCERRELAIVNVGGAGSIVVDGTTFELETRDVLYIGVGARDVEFHAGGGAPRFFLSSAKASTPRATTLIKRSDAMRTEAGDATTANLRTVEKYIHEDGVRSDQLVLGITSLESGSVWNSMPPHTHDRRTEMYLYIDLDPADRIFHFMGAPGEPRVMTVSNEELVISPSWSMHFGAGTSNYAFVWVMAGENQSFADMDQLTVVEV
jgi:4-deoxy-L-threo-5-hexosulose-uronate ketol-isomerase